MIIKSSRNGTELEFSNWEGLKQNGGLEYYTVTVRDAALTAAVRVYAFDPFEYDLVKFSEELARDWKGWDGERIWSSLEGELKLNCTSDSTGHTNVVITLTLEDHWNVETTFLFEAGQLDDLAGGLKHFFTI